MYRSTSTESPVIATESTGTANFTDPEITMKICDGLTDYLAENGFSSIEEIVGKANPGFLGFPKDVQKG